MASIIQGFEYDIFISYRQKDNKYDGWVTEFVENLKRELDATFKEEVSLYFDINPHDGLLETHDVGDSLKEKLKCLVFIPILSRTYCDPKSFAWEHEFMAFLEQASQDRFGLKVKLKHGNIASRVLPVIIHEIEDNDIGMVESALGSVLRGVDFIYTSSGVNRPLRAKEEKPGENLNKIIYRDQINKVALAIQEVVNGLQSKVVPVEKESVEVTAVASESIKELRRERLKRKILVPQKGAIWRVGLVAAIIIAAIIFYPKIINGDNPKTVSSGGRELSIAIMPFENNTQDTLWNVWKIGIQDILVSSLSNTPDIKVMQPQTVNSLMQNKGVTSFASVTPDFSRLLSKGLDANFCVFGSIKKVGNTIRLDASIFDPRKEAIFKTHTIDGTSENILESIDSLSILIQKSVIISRYTRDYIFTPTFQPTNSPEAYRYYMMAEDCRADRNYKRAREFLAKAIELDSTFGRATLIMSVTCKNEGLYEEGKEWAEKAYKQIDNMDEWTRLLAEKNYVSFFETPADEARYYEFMLEIDDKYPGTYYDFGLLYYNMEQFDKAIPLFEKSLELYDRFDEKPYWIFNYSLLGYCYFTTGQYKKIEKLYTKAEKDFPGEAFLSQMRASLSLIKRDSVSAKKHIDDYISIRRLAGWSEAGIVFNLGEMYKEASLVINDEDYMDKAEQYHRQEVVFEPGNMWRLFDLGWFLIQTDRNVDEGLDLVRKAMEMNGNPNYYMLDAIGWGLYKKGEYSKALELLEEARGISPYYYHSIHKHLLAVKTALAEQI